LARQKDLKINVKYLIKVVDMKGNLDPKFDYIRRKAPEIAIPTEKRIK
jgi:hypothetical protein